MIIVTKTSSIMTKKVMSMLYNNVGKILSQISLLFLAMILLLITSACGMKRALSLPKSEKQQVQPINESTALEASEIELID